MISSAPSWKANDKLKAAALLELRRRQADRQQALAEMPAADFLAETWIEVPAGDTGGGTLVPFAPWPAQRETIATLERERLAVILKARQLGMSWVVCGLALKDCVSRGGQTVLIYSQGQKEADEMIRRIGVLEHNHARRDHFPVCVTDNVSERAWANNSRVISLPATRRAGRSFTGSKVILDEWAFMLWGRETLAAVKPTIDAGGQLIIISTADGQGSAYHQFWQQAEAGLSGYTPIFLPWFARPERGPEWRDQKLLESAGDVATVKREYPANPVEAFTAAAGLVYDVWSDGPEDGNVTEAADYVPDGGPVFWAVDDGYTGKLDPTTGQYASGSSPRVFLLVQERADGRLCVFAEDYAVHTQQEEQIADVLALPYPLPQYAAMDSASADLRGRLHGNGIYTQGKPHRIEESIKSLRTMIAPDANGWRRVLVHPRCKHLRFEMGAYRYDDKGKPIDDQNHGPDALRYLAWTKRIA